MNQVRDIEAPDGTVAVEAVVPMPADELWQLLARPSQHSALDGGGTVVEQTGGPEVLTAVGEKFSMGMKRGLPYRTTQTVTAYVPGRTIEWMGAARARWRWDLEPVDATSTRVRESYVYGDSALSWVLRKSGMVESSRESMRKTLEQLGS